MKSLKLIALAALAVLMACSAQRKMSPVQSFRSLMPLLERSEKVDSCLAVLRSIDTTSLTRPADKARWSLLYAMALDKNYIDTTDLSVLEPAIDRYTHWTHLSRLDKFYTWYYKGRIEENAKIYDVSLDSYLHAERYMSATSNEYRSRLYFGMERLYVKTLSRSDAFDAVKKALVYSRNTGDMLRYGMALCDCAAQASTLSQYEAAKEYLDEFDSKKSLFPRQCLPSFYRSKVVYYSAILDRDSLKYYLDRYVLMPNSIVNMLSCSFAAIKLGDYTKASEFLSKYEEKEKGSYPFLYYACRSEIRKARQDYKGALEDLESRSESISEIYVYNLDREVAKIEERYHDRNKRVMLVSVFVSGLLIVLFIFIVTLFFNRRKQRLLVEKINDTRTLYERVLDLMSEDIKGRMEHSDDFKSLGEVLYSLGSDRSVQTVDTLRGSVIGLVKTKGCGYTTKMVALIGAVHCNNAFSSLLLKGLTDFEIGYCFLLMLGMNTSELKTILRRGNLKNVNMEIRKKLGIEDVNVHLYDYLRSQYVCM